MNCQTPCKYQPCWFAEYPSVCVRPSAPSRSYVKSPFARCQKYSPCSLKFVRVALPSGAYFHTKSAIVVCVFPPNDVCAMLPAVSGSLPTRSTARVSRYDTPARQVELVPTSPPACANALHAPALLLLRGLPGNASPFPTSAPSSRNVSVGATHFSCAPSCVNWPPKNA